MIPIKLLLCFVILLLGAGCSSLPSGKDREGIKPVDASTKLNELREKNAKIYNHIERAGRLINQGNLDEAEAAYNEALKIDPQDVKAQSGLQVVSDRRKHEGVISEARQLFENGDAFMAERRVRQVLMEDPNNKDALSLVETIQQERDVKKRVVPVLKSTGNPDISLEFRDANLKMVFEVLSRNTGINFILDKDIRPDQKASIYIKTAPLKDVLDAFLTANQLQKKIVNETTVIIYPDNPIKSRDYEELVLRNFYLANADVKQLSSLIKSILNVKDVYSDEKNNLLIVRDTEDTVKMVERLVRSMDVAEPEVMLEMEVLEVNKTTQTELGINYPNQLSVIDGTKATLTLNTLKHLSAGKLALGLPSNTSLGVNFSSSDSYVNLLANPSIRVKNREKAKIHVGDRIPINSSTSTSNGVVSNSTQYLDVGLKLEVEPVINVENEVSIRVGLEVSSASTVNTSGTAPKIGTRNATTILKLKDGETQILAGLIQDQDTKNISKLPGLGDLPLLGRLFSDRSTDKNKTDIILSITPHVIRNIAPQKTQAAEVPLGSANKIGVTPTNVIQGIPSTLAPFMNPNVTGTTGGSTPGVPPQSTTPATTAPATPNSFTLPNGLTFPLGGESK